MRGNADLRTHEPPHRGITMWFGHGPWIEEVAVVSRITNGVRIERGTPVRRADLPHRFELARVQPKTKKHLSVRPPAMNRTGSG
jgi:hypothetical protein